MTASFLLPTRILTGNGCLAELGQAAACYGHSALLVCGRRAMRTSGILDRAIASLESAGTRCTVYDHVQGEAALGFVEEGIALLRAEGCDMTIGLGGGSAMDVAKAVAGLALLPGTVAEYHGGRPLEGPGIPFVAVPTTAGTGAEVTKNAVLIDPGGGGKNSIRRDDWFARVALVDPELTLGLPKAVTAASGSDALCQAIETYVSIGAMPVTDALCEDAIRRIGRSLARACDSGGDIDARADMLYGSLLAGIALANARLGAVHGIAHPLGFLYGIPHGVLCGLLLPPVMRYNLGYAAAKYARVAELLGVDVRGMRPGEAAEASVDWVESLFARIGIPGHLSGFGVSESDWPIIVGQSLPSGSLKSNPRPMAAEDVRAVLAMAM